MIPARVYYAAGLVTALVAFFWFFLLLAPGTPVAEANLVRELVAAYGGEAELDDNCHVVRVRLEGSCVNDTALTGLHQLPYLRRVSLHGSSITDAGLLELGRGKRIRALGLTETRVTDTGLSYLRKMTSLRHVWVSESGKITPQGISSLQRALPGLQVHIMGQGRGK